MHPNVSHFDLGFFHFYEEDSSQGEVLVSCCQQAMGTDPIACFHLLPDKNCVKGNNINRFA